MADLNNDSSPEIIVGNQAGGLSFYSNSLPGCPLAINNVLSDYQVNVYPNPANSHLIIDTDDANGLKKQITLTDLSGRIIHSQNTFSRSTLLNTEKFANGIYLITIAAQSNNITKKIIIRHD
ncbi:MAG: T9SS type A sorting domain-containing protein [Bacteroidota bacterium]|nr:MAG: T9SS type A sorting domain-containing protein [Bacteroidota bacterium]